MFFQFDIVLNVDCLEMNRYNFCDNLENFEYIYFFKLISFYNNRLPLNLSPFYLTFSIHFI